MNIAIVGSGPSSFYTVQSLLRDCEDINIDIFERLPAPFGLVRYGVAPDHQKTKNIIRLFSKYLFDKNVFYFGNVEIGKDIDINFLSDTYDAVILSSGAPDDKSLEISGTEHENVFGSAEFVGWYNGNPDYENLSPDLSGHNAVIIGNGNVALDCARVLAKTKEEFYNSDIMSYSLKKLVNSNIENIYIVGRRTPKDAKFTIAELRELNELKLFLPLVDYDKDLLEQYLLKENIETKIKKNIEVLINFKKNLKKSNKKIIFKFLSTPHEILNNNGKKTLVFKKNVIENDNIKVTNTTETLEADLIISAIGYKVNPINDLEIHPNNNYFVNTDGHIKKNIYTNGWASGASVGVIGSNKLGGSLLSKKILDTVKSEKKDSRNKIIDYLNKKNVKFINKDDWNKIDQQETKEAEENFVRKKFVNVEKIFNLINN